jgi:hypothetical protein
VAVICTAGPAISNNIIRRMRIASWIPKATDTHSEYVILIAFPLQQWLHERASVLRYTQVACLVYVCYEVSTTYAGVARTYNMANVRRISPAVFPTPEPG